MGVSTLLPPRYLTLRLHTQHSRHICQYRQTSSSPRSSPVCPSRVPCLTSTVVGAPANVLGVHKNSRALSASLPKIWGVYYNLHRSFHTLSFIRSSLIFRGISTTVTMTTSATSSTLSSLKGPHGYAQARQEATTNNNNDGNSSSSLVYYVENRPYLPLLKVDPSSEESVVNAAKIVFGKYFAMNAVDGINDGIGAADEADEKKEGQDDNNDSDNNNTDSNSQASNDKVTRISGGLTNALYLIGSPSSPSSILVRIFGAEGMIDRDLETTNLARLCATSEVNDEGGKGVIHEGIKLIGRFGNGRVETWIPGMRQAHHITDYQGKTSISGGEKYGGLVLEVARQFARLHHGFPIPEYYLRDGEAKLQPTLWKVIHSWIDELSQQLSHENFRMDGSVRQIFCEGTTGKKFVDSNANDDAEADAKDVESNNSPIAIANEMITYLSSELKWVQSLIDSNHPDAPIGFCHNDLCAANILVNASIKENNTANNDNHLLYNAKTVCLIDYEYGSINYAMYDIANFFNEHTGGNDNGIPNYDLYPSLERQCHFLEEYVRERDLILSSNNNYCNNGRGEDNSDDKELEIRQLQLQVDLFQMINSLYWGIWGIVQASEEVSNGTFQVENARERMVGEVDGEKWDYLRYGRSRLERYRDCKKKCIAE